MTKTFTEDDLVRFLYDEVSDHERIELEESLQTDFRLQDQLDELSGLLQSLDAFVMKAPGDVINRILYASKNLQSA